MFGKIIVSLGEAMSYLSRTCLITVLGARFDVQGFAFIRVSIRNKSEDSRIYSGMLGATLSISQLEEGFRVEESVDTRKKTDGGHQRRESRSRIVRTQQLTTYDI